MANIYSRNHMIIVNYPREGLVREIIETIQELELQTEIFVLAPTLKNLPFHLPRVDLVSGSVVSWDTYQRAEIEQAKKVLVLRSSEDPMISDAVTASIVTLIKNHHPSLFVAAECLSQKHSELFKMAKADSIIYSETILNDVLSHSVLDPGTAEILATLINKKSKHSIFRTLIGKLREYSTYSFFSKRLLDQGYTVLAMRRENQMVFHLHGETLKHGDEVYYIGHHRLNWIEIKKEAKLPI
ncbi:MAG: NAD-binding protein [Planctomycetota bacterium]